MNIALKVENLKKTYGNTTVLKGINFHVNKGETFGLLGANGAGKSTTLECIEGVKSFDSGNISIFGKDVRKYKELHKLLGVQLQCSSLQKNITVYESMVFYCRWHGIDVRTDLLNKFGLEDLYKKQYGQLSIGQKRRLHLALSICNNPKILILDEPTAGLDIQGRNELHEEIRLLKAGGVTIILASHDMAEVEMLCDRIAIVVKGDIKFIGAADEIASSTNKEKRIRIKTTKHKILNNETFEHSKVEEKNGHYVTLISADIEKSLNEILETVNKKNDKIEDLSIEGISLEEKFMEVVFTESKVSESESISI